MAAQTHRNVSAHGNPTVLLPADHTGGRVVVVSQSDDLPVWQSHGIAECVHHTRVDMWHGRFLGTHDRCAVLDADTYEAHWHCNGTETRLGKLDVAANRQFAVDFTDWDDLACADRKDWLLSGKWIAASRGLVSADAEAFAFHDGAMHGRLRGAFRADDPPAPGACWGLIGRHYSAFAHLRVICRQGEGRWSVCLARYFNQAPELREHDVIAETWFDGEVPRRGELTWHFNGTSHRVLLDGREVLSGFDGFMGGVTVVGLFAERGSVCWSGAALDTTQHVPVHVVDQPAYRAEVRPGNISHLTFKHSGAPAQNVCWESGVQFGHIGGSELKFTQRAQQHQVDEGEVFTSITWAGPMPKFVEQSQDVRGHATGAAYFHRDQVILDDRVLARVRRSVGPDLDLLSRLLAGPARVALGDATEFRDWAFPTDGASVPVRPKRDGSWFPAAVLFPLDLGGRRWWLKTLTILRYPPPETVPGHVAGWCCPRGLTASHDVRVAPTEPGREYAYTLVMCWQDGGTTEAAEQDLLQLRHDWSTPANVTVHVGGAVSYDQQREHPAEALGFDGCFDRARGQYVVCAHDGALVLNFDPCGIRRRAVTLAIRDWPGDREPSVAVDGNPLRRGRDFLFQTTVSTEACVRLFGTVSGPIRIEVT